MRKFFDYVKSFNISFIFLNIYIIILVFLPKNMSELFHIPIRLGMTTLLLFLYFLDYKNKKIVIKKNKFNIFDIIPLLFLITTIPSIFVSRNVVVSIYSFIKILTFIILFYLLMIIKFTKKEYKFLLYTLIFTISIISLIGLIQYIFEINLFVKNSGVYYYPGAKGRVETTFSNAIYFSIFINMIFALVYYVLLKSKNKVISFLLIFLCCVLYADLVFTFTRSAIVIFFVILFICLITSFKQIINYKTLIVIFSILLISVFTPGAPELIKKTFTDTINITKVINKFLPFENNNSGSKNNPCEDCNSNVDGNNSDSTNDFDDELNNSENNSENTHDENGSENSNSESDPCDDCNDEKNSYVDYDENSKFVDYSLQHRESFAKIAKAIATDNKFTGVGLGAYIDYMNSDEFDIKYNYYTLSKTHPHSALILTYAETGIFGLISFCLFLIYLLLKSFNIMIYSFRKKENLFEISSIAFAICSGFVIINVMSENAFYDTQVTYLFVILYSLLLNYCSELNEGKKLLFISSTGGHLDEMLQLKEMFNKYDFHIITEKTKSNMGLKDKYSNKVNYLVYGTKDHKLVYPFKLLYNCLKSLYLYLRIRPKYIISTGAHTAGPMCCIGKLFGSKIIFIESFANIHTKTVTGRLIYKFADLFIVQWESMLDLYPNAVYGGWIF